MNEIEDNPPPDLEIKYSEKNTTPIIQNKMNKEFYTRIDKFGNVITHGGKQKISFIDKISKTNFVEVIRIANYKEYNKNDEQTHFAKHGCCVIV